MLYVSDGRYCMLSDSGMQVDVVRLWEKGKPHYLFPSSGMSKGICIGNADNEFVLPFLLLCHPCCCWCSECLWNDITWLIGVNFHSVKIWQRTEILKAVFNIYVWYFLNVFFRFVKHLYKYITFVVSISVEMWKEGKLSLVVINMLFV